MAARANVLETQAAQTTSLVTASGASAQIEGETITVRDRAGAVVVVFDAETGRAELRAPGDFTLAAEGRLTLRGAEVKVEGGRLEIVAERVIERAGSVYREIEDVVQTRAGRVRTLVKGIYQLFGKRVAVRSEEDASIDGQRVLLG
jgi:hypothetical protein